MRRDIRCFRPVAWLALATAGLAAPAQAGCSRCRPLGALPFERTASAVYSQGTPDSARPLVVVGDTQRTSWLECWLGREVNDGPQRRLLAAIAEERPSGVIIVGDLVFQGDSESDWQYFDDLMAPVRRLAVPVLPLMGNHDYQGDNAEAIRNVSKRFASITSSRASTSSFPPAAEARAPIICCLAEIETSRTPATCLPRARSTISYWHKTTTACRSAFAVCAPDRSRSRRWTSCDCLSPDLVDASFSQRPPHDAHPPTGRS